MGKLSRHPRDILRKANGDTLIKSMVLVMARWEAGQCAWRPNSRATFSDDAHMRVGKQLLAVKKPNWERGRVAA
jgi:hypothetical protein